MRRKTKVNWKIRLLLSILGGTLLVIVLLFGITYGYFVNKLTENNKKIVQMTSRSGKRFEGNDGNGSQSVKYIL